MISQAMQPDRCTTHSSLFLNFTHQDPIMENIIVYIDDLDFAKQQIAPMKSEGAAAQQCTHWILVVCPPRMTRHISKWVSYSARENWRAKWADKLMAQITPDLLTHGDQVTQVLASSNLTEQTQHLISKLGAARVLDARRPKFGHDLQPVTQEQKLATQSRWTVPGAVAGMGAALVIAAE
jgi:hypothetical protein